MTVTVVPALTLRLFQLVCSTTRNPGAVVPTETNVWFPVADTVTVLPDAPAYDTQPELVPASSAVVDACFDPDNVDIEQLFNNFIPAGDTDPVYDTSADVSSLIQPKNELIPLRFRLRSVLNVLKANYSLQSKVDSINLISRTTVSATRTESVIEPFPPILIPSAEFDVIAVPPQVGESGVVTIPPVSVDLRTRTPALTPSIAGVYGPFPEASTLVNGSEDTNITNIFWRRRLIGFTLTYDELTSGDNSVLSGGATITGLSFFQTDPPRRRPLPDYAIAMMHMPSDSSNEANPTLTTTGRTNFTTVKNPHSFDPSAVNELVTVEFDNNFQYDGSSAIGIIFAWGQCPVSFDNSGRSYLSLTGKMYRLTSDSPGAFLVTDSTTIFDSSRPVINFIVA